MNNPVSVALKIRTDTVGFRRKKSAFCFCGKGRHSGKVFSFRVPMEETVDLEAVSGELRDTATLHYVNKPDPSYRLSKKVAGGGNWT